MKIMCWMRTKNKIKLLIIIIYVLVKPWLMFFYIYLQYNKVILT